MGDAISVPTPFSALMQHPVSDGGAVWLGDQCGRELGSCKPTSPSDWNRSRRLRTV